MKSRVKLSCQNSLQFLAKQAFRYYPARDLNSQEQCSPGPEPGASTNFANRACEMYISSYYNFNQYIVNFI